LALSGHAARRVFSNWPAMVLIVTSIFSASAAVAGLKTWVPVAAAVAAILSGLRVLYVDLVVPLRVEAVSKATVRARGLHEDGRTVTGTAFQVGSRRWVTAAHLVGPVGSDVRLRIEGHTVSSEVAYRHQEVDLAVLVAVEDYRWHASISRIRPDPGDKFKIIGWPNDPESVQVGMDYVLQGTSEDSNLVLTGPVVPRGFSGSPVIDIRSGKVVGVTVGRREGEFAHLTVTLVTPMTLLPPESVHPENVH
jgi:hypothetical protein